jgi:hypothetical protein
MTAPDAATTATITEPENLSRMMASLCVQIVPSMKFPELALMIPVFGTGR